MKLKIFMGINWEYIWILLVVASTLMLSIYLFRPAESLADPSVLDPDLNVQVVAEGLKFPTTMAFLGPDDILVLEKNNGTVMRILNGNILSEPVLDVNVANKYERGMLGVDVSSKRQKEDLPIANSSSNTAGSYVFLYYTEADKDGHDVCPRLDYCEPGTSPLGNRVYRYELDNSTGKLLNPMLLMDLPANGSTVHNGGKLAIGPDDNVYFTVGDLNHRSATENIQNTTTQNETSGIYRISQEGKPVQPILSNQDPLNKYYAYGIRNSYGIDFDPITGRLWDTENGPSFGDEINLVEPGFNSGWVKLQGPWYTQDVVEAGGIGNLSAFEDKTTGLNPEGLEDFGGTGKYSPPEFTWPYTVAPTAIVFLDSPKLGSQYQNDIFVGDFNLGNIYHFPLNQNRTELLLDGALYDKVANSVEELVGITFAKGFSRITDIQVSPYDGYLYVVAPALGKIYRIVPAI
jgi:glucose/arabinose dehydrogenase